MRDGIGIDMLEFVWNVNIEWHSGRRQHGWKTSSGHWLVD